MESAIAQTCAEMLSDAAFNVLGASFFFSPALADVGQFFATVALQIAAKEPTYGLKLGRFINNNPFWNTKNDKTQFNMLLADRFQEMSAEARGGKLKSWVVIVDGLDRCLDTNFQRRLVTLVTGSINTYGTRFPLRWAFFIHRNGFAHELVSEMSPLCETVLPSPPIISEEGVQGAGKGKQGLIGVSDDSP